ncbi:MAG: tRNA pseudouridine(38-40) synthase TruA [Bacteroidetes bacterium]|nr:tRNA pseudouridine(38-40) synthase TruA [Bacteroidota bacterium]HET6244107.1 tRNA pseudouridine(38-40) synthase TruA [Bacteroidia bacterium]
MQRYFIQLAYKGTRYHGWQIQQNAHSVQAELNNAMTLIFEEKIESTGCGRTDTGVHARDFYAHFDAERADLIHPDFTFKLNRLLPKDIAIKKIVKVVEHSHARYDAVSRTYKYYIVQKKDPFNFDTAYYYPGLLNLEQMNSASALLFDYSDFSCFCKTGTHVKTNVCKIIDAKWAKQDDHILFTITADRFLRNMVRAIVGTMIDIGKNKLTTDGFKKIIENKDRTAAGFSVPACGLFLDKVTYPEGLML